MATVKGTGDRILPTMKISEVLRLHPELLEVLVGQSPAFERLRNPVLRRIQSRLVTVEQAARIGGVDPGRLVRTLNAAIGRDADDEAPARPAAGAGPLPVAEAGPPVWVGAAPIAVELDVRPHQRRGEEPFSAIMAAVAQVPDGQVFKLRNTFDPVPLYAVLGQRGFAAWSRQVGPEDWEIWFLNQGKPAAVVPAEPVAAAIPDTPPTAEITIDISELVPPEPMLRIMRALEELEPGGILLVHHVRRPIHLYPLLEEQGFRHATRELDGGRVELRIQKPLQREGAGEVA